jgi:TetR/AcrR family transcriptional repressor of nem operon
MQTIGYHSFNYKQISGQLGIKNSSIHHYFPSKDDLAVAVIEKDKEDFLEVIKQLESLRPGLRAEAFLQHYTGLFKNGRKLCVIGTFGMAYNDVSDRIKMAISSYVGVASDCLTDIFRSGLATGEFETYHLKHNFFYEFSKSCSSAG